MVGLHLEAIGVFVVEDGRFFNRFCHNSFLLFLILCSCGKDAGNNANVTFFLYYAAIFVRNSGVCEKDGLTHLLLSDDAARVHWGGKWRMPTEDEFGELFENCVEEEMELNGKRGKKYTSKINGNCIFFPDATNRLEDDDPLLCDDSSGGYWSSSAIIDRFSNSAVCNYCEALRWSGMSVRPVF